MMTMTSSKLFQKEAKFDTWMKIATVSAVLLFLIINLTEYSAPIWGVIFIPAIVMYVIQEYKNSKNLKKAEKDQIFVKNDIFLSTATYPQPGTTLMYMLKAEGMTCQDIKAMQLMTCSLQHGCDYYQKKLIEDGYRIDLIDKIDIYGYDDRGSEEQEVSICESEKVELHPTEVKLTRHINIITTRDKRCFVCYEPHHIVNEAGEDILEYGSFLVKIQSDNIKNIMEKFEQEIFKKEIKERAA